MITSHEAREDWLIDDAGPAEAESTQAQPWKVLVVDDEPDIHTVSRLALNSVRYKGCGIQLLSAYTAEQAFVLIRDEPDIALVLLD
ncbi:hypothetical protein ABTF63_19135, partial [Acinetobacter baumannii]